MLSPRRLEKMHKLHGGELETLILLPADHNTQCQFTSCPRKKLSVATQMSEVGTHTSIVGTYSFVYLHLSPKPTCSLRWWAGPRYPVLPADQGFSSPLPIIKTSVRPFLPDRNVNCIVQADVACKRRACTIQHQIVEVKIDSQVYITHAACTFFLTSDRSDFIVILAY
jgi:hypothetical protein